MNGAVGRIASPGFAKPKCPGLPERSAGRDWRGC